jgi:uncharacterized OB-fold protein
MPLHADPRKGAPVTEYAKPLPVPSPESEPFWEACRRHELVLQRCSGCGSFWFPPGAICPRCHSESWNWAPTSGLGIVYSFAVVHRVYHPGFADTVPYVVGVVELQEGPRLPTAIVGAPIGDIRCDMPVEVVFEDVTEDVTLPKFRPRPSAR